MEFIYQIQFKRDLGWSPVINSVTGHSLDFSKYEEALEIAHKLHLNGHSVRIVKYKFNVVKYFMLPIDLRPDPDYD